MSCSLILGIELVLMRRDVEVMPLLCAGKRALFVGATATDAPAIVCVFWDDPCITAQVCPPNGDVWCPCASSQCVGGACMTVADGTCPVPTTKFAPLTAAMGQPIKVRHFLLAAMA